MDTWHDPIWARGLVYFQPFELGVYLIYYDSNGGDKEWAYPPPGAQDELK